MITLVCGSMRAVVSPDDGGAVMALETRIGAAWQPVFRPQVQDGGTPRALASAMFVMVPFANRARGNRLVTPGRDFHLSPNSADPLAIHGTGWERAWRVLDAGPDALRLGLGVDAGSYPFAFDAVLEVRLTPTAARLSCVVTNPGRTAIPAGIGFHPYLPRTPGTRLQFRADHVWLEGPGHLPTEPVTLPPELGFAAEAALPGVWRNMLYSGWDGSASVLQPELGYRLEIAASEALREVMLYTPPGQPVFALEPQSHGSGVSSTDAPAPARPMRLLGPGDRLDGSMTVTVAPIP